MKKLALKALKRLLRFLAKTTIRRHKPVVIGVTGSVGKTSTKAMITEVLKAEHRVRGSSKNFNNEIGLPLAILGSWERIGGYFFWIKVVLVGLGKVIFGSRNYPEILVLEYGVDKPGDMGYLLSVARPQIAVFTSLGKVPVHVEFFSGREGILREKAKIISNLPALGLAVLNGDEPDIADLSKTTRAQSVFFGFGKNADFKISNFSEMLTEKTRGISFKVSNEGSFVPFKMENVLGMGKAFSAAAAAVVGARFGINLVKTSNVLNDFSSPPGRMNIIKGKKGSVIIDDTYNSSPASIEEALRVLGLWKTSGKKIAVLGDMLELGDHAIEAHRKMGKLASESSSVFVTVGKLSKVAAEEARRLKMKEENVFACSSLREAVNFLDREIGKGDVVLIKASQSVRLEKAVKAVMAEPAKAKKLLVRQEESWKTKPGMYE